jgi:hypothetical protein
MTDIINEYFALADQGVDFHDARLAALRERMTDDEIERVMDMLDAAAEAEKQEAAALKANGRKKFGPHEVVPFPNGKR